MKTPTALSAEAFSLMYSFKKQPPLAGPYAAIVWTELVDAGLVFNRDPIVDGTYPYRYLLTPRGLAFIAMLP